MDKAIPGNYVYYETGEPFRPSKVSWRSSSFGYGEIQAVQVYEQDGRVGTVVTKDGNLNRHASSTSLLPYWDNEWRGEEPYRAVSVDRLVRYDPDTEADANAVRQRIKALKRALGEAMQELRQVYAYQAGPDPEAVQS